MSYAYDVDRPDYFPNLKVEAQAPWRGLTAIVQGKPYLVIDKDDNAYTLEGEDGELLKVQRFLWSGEVTEHDSLVAASRMSGSPLRNAGRLFLGDDGWQVFKGQHRFDVEAAVSHLDTFNYFSSSLKRARLSGTFVHAQTGDDIDFNETGHQAGDKTVGATEFWIVQGSDGNTYYISETGLVLDETDNIVGNFEPYADPDPDRYQYEDGWYEDWSGHEARTAAGDGFSFRGNTGGTSGMAEGVAVRPDRQGKDEILDLVESLPRHDKDRARQRELIPEWAINRGGKVAAPFESEPAAGGGGGQPVTYAPGVILVARWVDVDHNWLLYSDKCVGIIAEAGGLTSHGVVVARERNIPIVVDAAEAANIQPGDTVRLNGDTGVVDVNGGGGDVDRMAPGQQAAMGVLRFVWSQGNSRTADIPAEDPDGGVLHYDMINEMMEAGELDYTDMAFGTVYDDGHADIVSPGQLSDQDALHAFLQQNGATGELREVSDMSALGKVEEEVIMEPKKTVFDAEAADTTGRHFLDSMEITSADEDPVVCPKCGSHTIRMLGVEDNTTGTMTCLTCKNEWTREVVRNPEAKVADMQKGSPYPENSDKNAPDHSPKGQKWPKKVNSIYNACVRENKEDGEPSDDLQEKCARVAWAKYKEMGGKKSSEGEDDGSDMPDWFPAQLQMQLELELAEGEEKESKVAVAADSNGNELEAGKWYVMHSQNYKVPDVIHVLNLADNRIEAAIEGDVKGHFPLTITQDDIAKNGYSFEPYEEHEVPEVKAGGWKISRTNFTPSQQRDLINENMGARARNYDKLDLDGTHYPRGEASPDGLDAYFLW